MTAPFRPEDPDRPRARWPIEDDRYRAGATRRLERGLLGLFALFVFWMGARLFQAWLAGRWPG